MNKINSELLFAKTPLIVPNIVKRLVSQDINIVLDQLWRGQRLLDRKIHVHELQNTTTLTKGYILKTLNNAAKLSVEMDNKGSQFYLYLDAIVANWRVKREKERHWIEYQPQMKAAKGFNADIWPTAIDKYAKLVAGIDVKVVDTRSPLERLMAETLMPEN